jgi:hypothetical protein
VKTTSLVLVFNPSLSKCNARHTLLMSSLSKTCPSSSVFCTARTPRLQPHPLKDMYMPLAVSCFALFGFQSYQILRLSPKASQDCAIQTITTWDSEDGMR